MNPSPQIARSILGLPEVVAEASGPLRAQLKEQVEASGVLAELFLETASAKCEADYSVVQMFWVGRVNGNGLDGE